MTCQVCSAPSFPLDGTCIFCHAPLHGRAGEDELLEYLAAKVPNAHVRRGHLNHGPITEISFDVAGRTQRAHWRKDELELTPPVDLTAWLDLLLTRLSDSAMHDANVRRSVLRAGWALR
jgi:hypothetical protein